jgi:hypothetical protein
MTGARTASCVLLFPSLRLTLPKKLLLPILPPLGVSRILVSCVLTVPFVLLFVMPPIREFLMERSERTGDEICQEGRLLFGEGESVWWGGKVKDASSGAKVDSKSVKAVLMVDWRDG